jgi:hypothetical protein
MPRLALPVLLGAFFALACAADSAATCAAACETGLAPMADAYPVRSR